MFIPIPEVKELEIDRDTFLAILEEHRAQYRSEEEA